MRMGSQKFFVAMLPAGDNLKKKGPKPDYRVGPLDA
jgi:hypothetical protein